MAKPKITNDGTSGGLLVGPTDKEGGQGIPAVVGGVGGRQVILGGNEVIINENAVLLHCEELNKINQSTGGRPIDCGLQKKSNTHTEMAGGGYIPSPVIMYTKSTGKPFKTFDSYWNAAQWIDKNIAEADYSKYEIFAIKDILTHDEVEEALGRPIRFLNDYVVNIDGVQYEKMGLRTTYQCKSVNKAA